MCPQVAPVGPAGYRGRMSRSEEYVAAAATAIDLVGLPQVAAAWSERSALTDWTVGGLAAHLLGQVFSVTSTLATPVDDADTVPLMAHYAQVPWRGVALDEPANVRIRAGGAENAEAGQGQLVDRARVELAELAAVLLGLAGDRVVRAPWNPWALTLDDFLTTRLMEIAVHSDDLAVSVGIAAPVLPDAVSRAVRHLLVDLAAQRHGDTAVLRGLARAERAPLSIAAL
jgi:hypothetical protein